MKNKIFKFSKVATAVLVLGLTAVGCTQDFNELNDNPNLTQTPLSYGVFNAANKLVTDATRNSFESGRVTLPWVQYSAQTNYTEEDRYQYRLTSGDALWRNLYAAAANYKKIIDMNTDPATKDAVSAYGPNENQIAASRVMLSYVFLQLADTFGDVPYYSYGNQDPDFQALKVDETIKPKFASQAKIYADIMKELKESAEMVNTGDVVFTGGDVLFGDGEKLRRFANSLRLRVATRVKGVVPGAEANIADAIAKGVMQSNDDNVGVTYENSLVNPSPMYNDFRTRSDFSVAKPFISLLKGETGTFGFDPRLYQYAAPIGTAKGSILDGGSYKDADGKVIDWKDPAKYVGQPYGLDQSLSTSQSAYANFFSRNVYKPNYTEILMEYSEVEFLLSEANGWNQTNYMNGVKASMEKWGVSDADIAAFVAQLPPATKETVLTQKYVALFMQPYEAWAEYRRTGYPNTSILLLPNETGALNVPVKGATTYVFTSLIDGLNDLPNRLYYPTVIQTLNVENYKAAATAIGGDKMNTKLIWDKN